MNRQDSSGCLWEELIDFLKTVAYETEQALASMAPAFAGAATAPIIDGPLPFGDALGIAAGSILFSAALVEGFRQAITAPTPSISASRTDERDKALAETRTRRQYNYWQADLIKGNVVVSTPLSLSEASLWVSMGGSIMCRNEAAARTIIWLNGYHNFVGPEIHGDCGFYPHFHPTRNHTGYSSIHIWFYGDLGVMLK